MGHPDVLPPSSTTTFVSGRPDADSSPPELRILHFNDVYHLDQSSREPVGGAARFATLCKEYREADSYKDQVELLTFFSGDAFNPSVESSVTKGSHMVPILNLVGTNCACVGNHDFDFGVDQFSSLAAKCTFPWLIANVLDPALGPDTPLGGAAKTHMITTSTGIKVGIIGLGEREWLQVINSLPPNLIYKSATATAKEIVPQLRAQGADIIVCLSHMREPNDLKLARQTEGMIDIILGGHDHYYAHSLVGDTHVLRSGTDFKQLSYITARRSETRPGRWDFEIMRRDVTSAVAPDAETQAATALLTAKLHEKLARPVGWTAAPLDSRFTTVRLRESNLGNLVCDVMRSYHGADCALMAGGTIRGDQIYPPGAVRVGDIVNCFPFEDPVVLLRVSGKNVLDALENGVSLYPALEGRFPQVSGIEFEFNGKKPSGQRIVSVKVNGEPLESEKKYTMATRGFMGRGKDGYDSLLVQSEGGHAEELVDEENGILISTVMRLYFISLRTIGVWKKLSPYWKRVAGECHSPVMKRKLSVVLPAPAPTQPSPSPSTTTAAAAATGEPRTWEDWLRRRAGLDVSPIDEEEVELGGGEKKVRPESDGWLGGGALGEDDEAKLNWEVLLMRKFFGRWAEKAGVSRKVCDEIGESEFLVDWTRVVAPVLEGRIKMVS